MAREVDLLIVDDEDDVVKIFERLARQEKYSCAVAKSGYEAIDFLSKHSVGVAVVDNYLPEVSGFQILEYVRSNRPDMEVIVVTGRARIEDAVRALKMGAFDYLTKPFDNLEIIISCLKQAWEKTSLKKKI